MEGGAQMITVGLFEAKNRLPELLDRAAKGETIIITKRGQPTAMLGPVRLNETKDKRAVIAAVKRFSLGKTLGGTPVRKLIEEGRE